MSQANGGVFKGPRTLSVMPTFQCTAACADCGTVSSPHEKTSTNWETVLSAINQAKALGFANVVFTGGEATLRWEILLKGVAHAHALGLPTRVVTNAFWAVTPEKARRRLEALISAGLDEINYSTGDEHCKYVPIDRVINAIVAAVELGLRTHVMVEMRSERKVTQELLVSDPRITALSPELRARFGVTESPWMPLDPSRVESYPPGAAANHENINSFKGCDSALQTYVLQPDGRVGACCGLGLRLIPELNVAMARDDDFLGQAIEEAESDFLKLWIRYLGPEKILAWASEKNPGIAWENMYAHRCQACTRLYKDQAVRDVILEHHTEMIAEVVQSAWMEQEYIPQWTGEVLSRREESLGPNASSA